MDQFWTSLVTIATAIVGVAIIAVLVSQKAQTGNVISAAGQAFANDLSAATGPVTGAVSAPNVGTTGFGGFSGQGSPTQMPAI
jgi:hypothetical protein